MIVRIMGEGQLSIDDAAASELNAIDDKLDAAVRAGDEQAFRAALHAMHSRAHEVGSPLPADALTASDMILPPVDATMQEVKELMGEDGLIPG
jgi:PspAA-like protein